MTEWSQGVTGDGPVILKDGQIAHIDEIVAELARSDELAAALRNVMALVGGYPETVPNELGLSAWRSIRRSALNLLEAIEE